MTTKLLLALTLLLAACGARTSAPPAPMPVSAPIAEASCDEPVPAPAPIAPAKPAFDDLGEGSCSK